jgi:ATP-dependent Clp protease ATP-binding subunit ClpC
MPDKMQRFTQRARRVLSLAQEEAERLQHSYIGTEHLLLGLMREEGGVAGRVLKQLGLDIKEVESLVERKTRSGQRTPFQKLDLSPGTKKVLELAVTKPGAHGPPLHWDGAFRRRCCATTKASPLTF